MPDGQTNGTDVEKRTMDSKTEKKAFEMDSLDTDSLNSLLGRVDSLLMGSSSQPQSFQVVSNFTVFIVEVQLD